MAPFLSDLIDPTKAEVAPDVKAALARPDANSPYFISLGVRTCEQDAGDVIPNAIKDTIESCSIPGSKAQRAAVQRHTNPCGNLYGMVFSMSEQDRLAVAVKFIEFLCILDDVMEELPYEQAIREHEVLCQVLNPTSHDFTSVSDSKESESLDGMKKFLADIRETVLSLGIEQGHILLADLERTLRQRECAPATFATLEDYAPYRIVNLDWYFVCLLLRWSMDIDLVESECKLESLNDFEYATGVIAGFGNDYYSWNREKKQYSESDRVMNAVPVLMRQHSISEPQAKATLQKAIIEQVNHLEDLKKGMEDGGASEGLKHYASGLEYLAAGYMYWCSTCPRYYAF
ncbi:terpenoid synthase [Dendrothele bispora CBS 962.96]|uniref:Terpenoid synthase n=1 Tax=Dendrothele bispora (strain CBS 962.96) TaxID=1314807 RepID=A0A4S8LTG1_DENBC|nr:terpenoid synthase [Dendrothele bispora CBS 962.96]